MLQRQLFQHLLVGGGAGLAAPEHGKPEPLVEHVPELLGGGGQELAAGELEDLLKQRVDLLADLVGKEAKAGYVDADAGQLQVAPTPR